MAEFPALPLWTDAYIADTTHLTMLESGCYLQILMVSWRRADCAVDDDNAKLSRICRMRLDKWLKIRPILEPFFIIKDGLWVQKRLQKEAAYLAVIKSKRESAARARWLKDKETRDALALQMECTHTHTFSKSKKEGSSNDDPKKESASLSAQPIATSGPQELSTHPAEAKDAQKGGPPSRGCRIPDDWQPSADDLAYATSQGCTSAEIARIILDFSQYWRAKAGKDAVKRDWHATWQRWIRVDRDGVYKRSGNGNGNGQENLREWLVREAIEGPFGPMAVHSNGTCSNSTQRDIDFAEGKGIPLLRGIVRPH